MYKLISYKSTLVASLMALVSTPAISDSTTTLSDTPALLIAQIKMVKAGAKRKVVNRIEMSEKEWLLVGAPSNVSFTYI
ncbi:hypothetical protein [Shewanella atlantica]|uniref:Uncharacterized protein n=1 Tax=Shewanella atlantica TaxID=271099 RepID=A0A3S0K9J8_9GAMM|nr:hypothetical protein [Shewanella atlantica]RTR25694.1 hypothetical protein EKG39_22935 [Shewanella atlantica]